MAKLFPTVNWAKGASIYEVNIRQYTPEGTFNAFREHLPRLQDMGVEILWLMPITPISIEKRQGTLGSYYACSSYTKINPEFGTLADLTALVADVHSRGMKLIIDWVANHTGCDHEWKYTHPDWFEKNEQNEFYDKNGWADVIDLNYTSTAMRQEMIRSMQYWITACDIDGFRCDMAHLVPLDFWMQARTACDAVKPVFWLAETDNNEYHEVFDTSYAWSWMHASERYFKQQSLLSDLRNELFRFADLPADCYKMLFTSNHDENSWNGTEYEKYGAAARMLAVLSTTYASMPLLYSGQEIPNHKRLRFFEKDALEWKGVPALQTFYSALFNYRKTSAAIRYGSLEIISTNADDAVMAYLRHHEERTVLVLLNFTPSPRKITLQHERLHGIFESRSTGLHYTFTPQMEFELDGWGWLVYGK